jgi:uncharacterized protein YndB with AHSA1/START domain
MSKPSFVYVTYIRATAEKIWDAITDPAIAGQYWGGGCHVNVSDWKVGSKWEHQRNDGSGVVDIVGTVAESNRPRRLVITWASPSQLRTQRKLRASSSRSSRTRTIRCASR